MFSLNMCLLLGVEMSALPFFLLFCFLDFALLVYFLVRFLCKGYFKLFFHSVSADLVRLITSLVKQHNQDRVNCRMVQCTVDELVRNLWLFWVSEILPSPSGPQHHSWPMSCNIWTYFNKSNLVNQFLNC